ncbi:MAG: DUF2760 domain-containing protein [Planctomycetota bacterium]|nr:DUF2760 domain-containing protein [Planctomycetota bacterium]
MGLLNGAKSFISLLTGEEPQADTFPDDWKPKTTSFVIPKGDSKTDKKTTKKPKKGASDSPSANQLTPELRTQLIERGASELLVLLQREGRLIDFLEQDIEDEDDEDIGAAARDIHKNCRKALRKHFAVAPVLEGVEEDDDVTVPKGFNPEEIRLLGKVKGNPPFKGTVLHPGWKAKKINLPQIAEDVNTNILAAAEVEL